MHSHEHHTHQHGDGCGHLRIRHGDHEDYLHDGHLHHNAADGEVAKHVLDVTEENPAGCHQLSCHLQAQHAEDAPKVPHGDHEDFLVGGRLHHVHGDHCDDHGAVAVL